MNDQTSRPVDRPKARLPRGFLDSTGKVLTVHDRLISKLSEVYASYGFDRLTTPSVEFADALGKFLPDQDRPHEGVFSFQDDDGQWLVLRYDLTAPLARYVAENFETLAFPYRRFQTGMVFRDEKPGPGRFREFVQFDADTVGTAAMAADAELCMLVADSLEALGLARGDYVVKVNNRKVLNGMLDLIGVPEGPEATPPASRCCAPWTSSTAWASRALDSSWAVAARTNPATSPKARGCPLRTSTAC